MANMYKSVLESGGVAPTGDAVEANVLAGKTFSNADGVGKTGTMVNNGAVSGTATPSTPYTIPEGYHNGLGSVTASQTGILDEDSYIFVYNGGGELHGAIPSDNGLPLGAAGGCLCDVTHKATVMSNAVFDFVAFNSLSDIGTPTRAVINTPYNISNYKYLLMYVTGQGIYFTNS